MSLVLRREEGESWYQAAIRQATKYGMEFEVDADYQSFIHLGYSDQEAAFDACYEWDVLDFVED